MQYLLSTYAQIQSSIIYHLMNFIFYHLMNFIYLSLGVIGIPSSITTLLCCTAGEVVGRNALLGGTEPGSSQFSIVITEIMNIYTIPRICYSIFLTIFEGHNGNVAVPRHDGHVTITGLHPTLLVSKNCGDLVNQGP